MRYLAVSRRWIESFYLGDRVILGRCHYDIFPNLPQHWKDAHRRGLAGEGVRMEQEPFELGAGGKRWTRWELLPWYKSDGSVGGIVLFTEDITVLKESAQRLQLAANVFTHTSESILITDADGAILDVNEAFTRITGYGREEVLGKNPRMLNSGRQPREFYTDPWAQLREKGQWPGEIWNRGKSGQILPGMLKDTERSAGRGDSAEVRSIDDLHQRLHTHAIGLLDAKGHNGGVPLSGLAELHTLKDNLLGTLQQYVQRP